MSQKPDSRSRSALFLFISFGKLVDFLKCFFFVEFSWISFWVSMMFDIIYFVSFWGGFDLGSFLFFFFLEIGFREEMNEKDDIFSE